MRTPTLLLCLLLIVVSSSYAQIIPINHEMKNLKVGNVFIYFTRFNSERPVASRNTYDIQRIIRHDTIGNKVYAVFQNGVRERADSSGVYWIPLNINTKQPFTSEYLRYPLFPPIPIDTLRILHCGESFMNASCYSTPTYASIRSRTEINVLGIMVTNFYLSSSTLTDVATILGPWFSVSSGFYYTSRTTLCGAVIEGKYYGDSACLVASSTPLRGEEFTSFSASLAPNPAADITTIRFILPTAQGLTVEIRDMLGREVVSPLVFDALSSGMNAIPIDVSSLPRGVYALRLRSTLGLRATTMFVKE